MNILKGSFPLYAAYFEFLCTCSWLGGQEDFGVVQELGLKGVRCISGGGCLIVESLQSLSSARLVAVAQRIEPVGCVERQIDHIHLSVCVWVFKGISLGDHGGPSIFGQAAGRRAALGPLSLCGFTSLSSVYSPLLYEQLASWRAGGFVESPQR